MTPLQCTLKKAEQALNEEHQTLTLAIDLFERLAFTDAPVEMNEIEEAASRLRSLYADHFLKIPRCNNDNHHAA